MRLFAFLLFVIPLGLSAESTRGQSLAKADLAFHFVCQQSTLSGLEDGIETFLRQKGFRVLNQAHILRERGAPIYDILIFGLDKFGLDKNARIFTISGLPRTKGRYAASLITRPPTRRSLELEDAILKLVSVRLGCEVRQITRGENHADATETFDRHYRAIEGLFEQARVNRRKSR